MNAIRTFTNFSGRLWPRSFHARPADLILVDTINRLSSEIAELSDTQLNTAAVWLREVVDKGTPLLAAEVAGPAFAMVKEAVRRVLKIELFDVQLLGGIALASGAIAEMQTGEGKTLASSLAASLHGLTGRGVHVATVNRYLAERDFQLLRPIYELLGLSVGLSQDGSPPSEKRAAYNCDITYATGYEFGFDFLRDQVALRGRSQQPLGQELVHAIRGQALQPEATVQRGHAFCIVDEIDSVLIDEATTPLVLSSPLTNHMVCASVFDKAKQLAERLSAGCDYVLQADRRGVHLTQSGVEAIYQELKTDSVAGLARPWSSYIEQALHAKLLMRKDVQYVVRDGRVRIVDEYTGRIFDERLWRDGLHQAVEAKEGVTVTAEKQSLARISRQRYFSQYKMLCGMTGTASGNEREFCNIYGLPVVVIPRRKACQLQTLSTSFFRTAQAKCEAIAQDVAARHAAGQPVLVGTRTIENSQRLATTFDALGLPFRLLNGVQDEDEAALVATAGHTRIITIATNMAGRGTDIKLDLQAKKLGGLHVIAMERNDSQRIDRQLIGRAARQGDPGSCQFFVSAEDELIQRFGGKLAKRLRTMADGPGQKCAASESAIRRAQVHADKQSYAARRQLMRQDLWLDELRCRVA